MRLGVLVPFTNTVLERDIGRLRPHGATTYVTRIGGYEIDQLPDARAMHHMGEADIDDALHLIAGIRPDAVLYGCTSATLSHGLESDAKLRRRIELTSGATAVTAAGAIVFALRKLNVYRVALASPYTPDLTDQAIAFLESAGVSTVGSTVPDGRVMSCDQGAFTPKEVANLARQADMPTAEAIVLCCTDLRAVEATSAIEADLGKPVVAVNRAMFQELAAVMETLP